MISFKTFFVWTLLLIVNLWNSSPLRSNLLQLQCTCYTIPTTSGKPMEVLLCERVNDLRHCLFHFLTPHTPLTDSLPSLNLLYYSKTDARFVQAVWSIPYVSVAFFRSLKHNFITYRSFKVSDCIFEIHQLWQSGFS